MTSKFPEPLRKADPEFVIDTNGNRVRVWKPRQEGLLPQERDFVAEHDIEPERVGMSPVCFDTDFVPWKTIWIDGRPVVRFSPWVPQSFLHGEAALMNKLVGALKKHLGDKRFRTLAFKCIWLEEK